MDDIEIIRCEIQSEIYERQIRELIEHLLKIDEAMQKSENQDTSLKPSNFEKAAA
jgi:hypothetical protein